MITINHQTLANIIAIFISAMTFSSNVIASDLCTNQLFNLLIDSVCKDTQKHDGEDSLTADAGYFKRSMADSDYRNNFGYLTIQKVDTFSPVSKTPRRLTHSSNENQNVLDTLDGHTTTQ